MKFVDLPRKGQCRICGKYTDLSFEHIPPKSTGNNVPTKGYDIRNMIANGRSNLRETDGLRYVAMQRGSGGYALCKRCNNYIGANYDDHYKNVILGFHKFLCSLAETPKELNGYLLD